MKRKFFKFINLFAGLLLLVSCGDVNGGKKETSNEVIDLSSTIETQYPVSFETDGEVVSTDLLKIAYVSDSPFKGVFNGFLYSDALDLAFVFHTMRRAFPVDDELKVILDSDETPIKVSINIDEKTVTYKINPKFR